MKARAAGEMPLVKLSPPREKRQMEDEKNFAQGETKRENAIRFTPIIGIVLSGKFRKTPIESLRRPSTPPPKANKEHSDESSENIYLFT